jgi:hypothetical protein
MSCESRASQTGQIPRDKPKRRMPCGRQVSHATKLKATQDYRATEISVRSIE